MREFSFTADGARLFAWESGGGAPLIMLHGGGADHRAAAIYAPPPSPALRLITPDLRASGKSRDARRLTWERLADDVAALLDHLGLDQAVVGGVSGGAGASLAFALKHPDRLSTLIQIMPVWPGRDRGLNDHQAQGFAAMHHFGQLAATNGIEAYLPIYERLPEPMRSMAQAMARANDPGSVATTAAFLASGVQPLATAAELATITAPVLLIPGDDDMHPRWVSDLYAEHLPNVTVSEVPPSGDRAREPAIAAALGAFCAGAG